MLTDRQIWPLGEKTGCTQGPRSPLQGSWLWMGWNFPAAGVWGGMGRSVGGPGRGVSGAGRGDQRLGQRGGYRTEGCEAGRLSHSCSWGTDLDIRVVAVIEQGPKAGLRIRPRIYVEWISGCKAQKILSCNLLSVYSKKSLSDHRKCFSELWGSSLILIICWLHNNMAIDLIKA